METKKTDRRPWCWAESEDSENWFGPFKSRERAVSDALASTYFEGDTIVVSRCNYPVLSDAVERWVESTEPLEQLHDHTDEEFQDYDNGETYAYRGNEEKARASLTDALVEWANKHVRRRWFSASGDDVETVDLRTYEAKRRPSKKGAR